MATITGAIMRTPRGLFTWRPVAFVVKAYEFVTRTATDRYVCLGVVGNWSHLSAEHPGDHTPYSTHDIWIHGHHFVPKRGTIYAIDLHVPDPQLFERWLLARLRAGFYRGIKYFNINNRHWNRAVEVAGKPFGRSYHSRDEHLHVSGMPGSEYEAFDFLADYEHYRTSGRNVTTPISAGRTVKPAPIDAAARNLRPGVKQGARGRLVSLAQAGLIGYGFLPARAGSIDGDFGPATDAAIRRLQKERGLPVTGTISVATWDKLFPEEVDTITRGDRGRDARLMQALLLARGFDPGALDGEFGDRSVAALKRFQVSARVKDSVVKGRGDGIGGDATWVALLTL